MPVKISIIGAAGTLGSCTAYRLATEGLADELVMTGLNQNRLKAHVWDIRTAITGLQDVKIREGDDSDLAGSNIVINTAGAPWRVVTSRMEKLEENIPIISQIAQKITRWCPEAVVITATNPVDPLNSVMHQLTGLKRNQILGYTLNDSTRFKAITADALGISSKKMQGMVIGEHGDLAVLLFSSLIVDGKPVDLDDAMKARITDAHRNVLKNAIALNTGWTSGWTSSIGLASMVSAITGKTNDVIPCSVILKGEYGVEDISMSVPVKLGPKGINEIIELELAPEEKTALQQSIVYLREIEDKIKILTTS